MTVFIGWSSGCKEIAEATYDFLENVFAPKIKIEISLADNAPGEKWFGAVKNLLDQADYAIFCISPSSHIPWICFEAGYLTKADTPFTALLFGMNHEMLRHYFTPLTDVQRQDVTFIDPESGQPNRLEMRKLLIGINDRAGEKHHHDKNYCFFNDEVEQNMMKFYPDYVKNIQKQLRQIYTIEDLEKDLQDLEQNPGALKNDDIKAVGRAVNKLAVVIKAGTGKRTLDQACEELSNLRGMVEDIRNKSGNADVRLQQMLIQLNKFGF